MLSNTDRTALASLATHLAPSADRSVLEGFVASHHEACMAELVSDQSTDQVRAQLLRVMGRIDEPTLDAARAVIEGYPDAVAEAGRTLLLRRHPAWVGIAWLAVQGGIDTATDADFERAVALANSGFSAAATPDEVGQGEALWAMAEQVEQVGWSDWYDVLIARALDADFADPAHQAEVRLLVGLHRAQREEDGADALLDAVVADDAAELQSRVHAAWVQGHRHPERAVSLFEQALAWIDEEGSDEEVRVRVQTALDKARTGGV